MGIHVLLSTVTFPLMYGINFHVFSLPIGLAVRVSTSIFSFFQATAHLGLMVLRNCSLNPVPFITLFFVSQNMAKSLQKALMTSLVFLGKVLRQVSVCSFKKVHIEVMKCGVRTLSNSVLKNYLSVPSVFLTYGAELCSEIIDFALCDILTNMKCVSGNTT